MERSDSSSVRQAPKPRATPSAGPTSLPSPICGQPLKRSSSSWSRGGARGDCQASHFGRFLKVFLEYQASRQEDPLFEPARPAIPARVRLPRDVGEGTLISDSHTAAVSDLFNGCYEILLEALVRFFLHVDEGESELTALADTAVDSMFTVIAPLGRLLTRLPVG